MEHFQNCKFLEEESKVAYANSQKVKVKSGECAAPLQDKALSPVSFSLSSRFAFLLKDQAV